MEDGVKAGAPSSLKLVLYGYHGSVKREIKTSKTGIDWTTLEQKIGTSEANTHFSVSYLQL